MKLLDTSVVVDIDRGGVEDRVSKLDDEGQHAISSVTVTELCLGVNKRYEPETEARTEAYQGLDRLIARFDILAVSRQVAMAAADIIDQLRRTGRPLNDLHDVYIAATARTAGREILTANVSHFERIDGVETVDWQRFS